MLTILFFFFFQAEDGIRDKLVTGVQTCALPICAVSTYWGPPLRASMAPFCRRGFGGARTVVGVTPLEWHSALLFIRAAARGAASCLHLKNCTTTWNATSRCSAERAAAWPFLSTG